MNSISENNSGKFKILVGVLSLLLIALAVYTITLFNDSKAKVSTLEIQKANIEDELEGLIANYDELIEERSEEHTSELQSRPHLVCRLLLEKKKKKKNK